MTTPDAAALERAKDGLHPYLATALEGEGMTEAEAREAANAMLDRAFAGLRALVEENARLREALAPLARLFHPSMDSRAGGDESPVYGFGGNAEITVGDIRRAVALTAPLEETSAGLPCNCGLAELLTATAPPKETKP